ncbi:MAG: oxidoreductase [Desulfitobacteriaceae bacterium]|nr:oxidoreductase [Desulfitobacteriaceae bacterium]MDI6880452.1 oxidoreductase [Desulfitobacteriaceae bacterium]MDI6913181.1 oxidoreductase [Desulfitobacteriaceae bacterium]
MMQAVVNVALVGYGLAGQSFHAPIITAVPGLHLKTVVQRHGAQSKERYPWVNVAKSVDEVLADPDIQLVVVATPNPTHYELARQLIEAGKHVVVDKPFTPSAQEAASLIGLAQKKQRVLSVFQNRRWDGDFLTVKRVVESGTLGTLVEYESHYDRYVNYLRPNTWKEEENPGAGILYDLGAHLIDQVLVLFGLPQSVRADLRRQRPQSRIDDSFEVVLQYESGLKAILKGSMLVREIGPHYVLHGQEGSFVKYGLDPQEACLKAGRSPVGDPLWGVDLPDQWGILNTQLSGLHFRGQVETIPGDYRAYYQNIYETITQDKELAVKPEDGYQTIRVIERAFESHRAGKTLTFLVGN